MSCSSKSSLRLTITPKGALFEKYGDETANEIMDLLELCAMRRCSKDTGAVPAIIFDCYHGRFDSVTWTLDKTKRKKARRNL